MFSKIAKRPIRRVQDPPVISLQGFLKGLNTFDAAGALEKTELASAINYYLSKRGQLTPRPGLERFTTTILSGSPFDAIAFRISSTQYDIISTATGNIYKVSSLGIPTLIDTVGANPQLFIYDGDCVICDGSYIKYLDEDGYLTMAYDAGDDNDLHDKLDDVLTTSIKIHTGQVGAGVNFTFPTYTDSFSIPLTNLKAKVKKVGSPTGNLIAKLYEGTVLLETSIESYDVSALLTTEQTVSFTFPVDNSDQSGWMSSAGDYRAVLEYTGGDTSNCVELSQIADGDLDGTNYTTVWVDNLTSPLIWLAPNLPPKASYGIVALKRPFFGGDPDNPGYLWYGNVSIKDYSTDNGGGWVGVIDDNRTTYPIGGLGSIYEELHVFGKKNSPYLSVLSGTQPSDYALKDTYKGISAEHRTIVNSNNDIWFAREAGVNNLKGVQAFGNMKSYSQAQRILDKFDSYWVDGGNNLAGFYKELNLYFLQIEGYNKLLVSHTELPFQNSLVEEDIAYPWTEFEFDNTITMLSRGTKFLLGMDDNFVYKFESTKLKDDDLTATEIVIEFNWRTAFVEMPFSFVDLEILRLIAAGKGGLGFNLNIYTQGNSTNPVRTIAVGVAQDGLLVDDATMLLDDAVILIDTSANIPVYPININCTSVQLEGDGLDRIFYAAASIMGCLIQYKVLEA